MIKPSDVPQRPIGKIDVESFIKEVEQDVINYKIQTDGRNYEVPEDYEGIAKIKEILTSNGYDVLSNLTGYRNGQRCITMLISVART